MSYVCGMDGTQDICPRNVCVAKSSQLIMFQVVLAMVFRHCATTRSEMLQQIDLLNEVCHNVTTGPELQPLSGELFSHRTASTEDGARLDVKAQGF